MSATWDVPLGLTVADLDRPEQWHVCGNCRQPITNRGREDCPNNKGAALGADSVFEEAEGDGDQDWCPDDQSGWDARNDADIDYGREVRAHGL